MEIQIPRLVHSKIMHWVQKSDIEVSGFGTATYYPETKVLWVHDAYTLKQTGGAVHTEIDADALAALMFKVRETGHQLKWWWHSHVNMEVFWSSTDRATIDGLAKHGWIGASVFNKKGEVRSAIGMKAKYSTELGEWESVRFHDSLPTFIIDDISPEVRSGWDKELAENVDQKKWEPTTIY